MPAPSTWNTPSTSPRPSRSKVAGSSSGMDWRSRAIPCRRWICAQARAMTVSVDSPRKSTLSSPSEFEHLHLELRHGADRVVFRRAFGGAVERNVVGQRTVGDDHPGGVRPGVARHALQAHGRVDQVLQVRRQLVGFLEGRHALQRLRDGHRFAGDVRHELGDPVDLGERDVQHAADVPQRRPCPQRAEGDDLSHLVAAVALGGVLEHARPLVVLEIEIDVRHRDPAGIEEALEDQPVFERVDQRDLEAVGDDRARRRPTGVVPDALLAGVAAQVPHDQEVGFEAHLVDHVQLIVQALADLGPRSPFAKPLLEPGRAQRPQVRVGGRPVRHVERRQVVALEVQVDAAPFGDEQGIAQRLGDLGEQRSHLVRGSQVVGRIGHAHAVGVGAQRPGLDAQQDVLQLGVLGVDVVHVVGGDEARRVALGQIHQAAVDRRQLADLMRLQLKEEALRAEDLEVPVHQPLGVFRAPIRQGARDFAGQAAGGDDQAVAVSRQEIMIDARAIVETFQLGGAGKLQEISVAGVVFRQEELMEGARVELRVPVAHAPRGEVGFHAQDRLDARALGGAIEVDHAEHRAVIGQRQSRHAQFAGALHQVRDAAQAVEQRVFGMDVQVNKRHGHSGVPVVPSL